LLIDLLVLSVLILFFYTVGINWVIAICKGSIYQTPIAIILGLALTFGLFSWFVKFNYQPRYAILFVLLIGVSGWIYRVFRKISFEIISVHSPTMGITSLLVGALSLYLNNQSKLLPQFSYRNGPDIFGWLGSSKYLCKVGNLDSLASNIQTSLGKQDLISAFSIPVPPASLSIIQIPSFRDQISGEFLIGANRTGLPGFQSYICTIFGEDSIIRISNSIFALSFILITMILVLTASKSISNIPKYLLIILGLFSLNTMALVSAYEGGLASLLATPIILILVVLIFQDDSKSSIRILAFASTLVALSTYFDLIIQLGIFFSAIFIALVLCGNIDKVFIKNMKYFLQGAAFGCLISLINLSSSIRLTLDRLTSQSYGGWNQGRPPTFPEYLGIFNWLPKDGASATPRNWLSLTLLLLLTLLILGLIKRLKNESQILALSTFLIYVALAFVVYVLGSDNKNNYILVKSGGIASLVFTLAIIIGFDPVFKSRAKSTHHLRDLSTKTLTILMPILALVSTVTYMSDWLANSNQRTSLNYSSKLVDVYNSYDLEVVGLFTAELTLFGDLHFGAKSRGFQFRTLGSNPPRKHAFIFPAQSNCEIKCDFFNKTSDQKKYKYIFRDAYMDIVEFSK
jgi:hypothetical protein